MKIYCLVLNKYLNTPLANKCVFLIENKYGNDRCSKNNVTFSNKELSSTCKNWTEEVKKVKKIEYLPNELFEI